MYAVNIFDHPFPAITIGAIGENWQFWIIIIVFIVLGWSAWRSL